MAAQGLGVAAGPVFFIGACSPGRDERLWAQVSHLPPLACPVPTGTEGIVGYSWDPESFILALKMTPVFTGQPVCMSFMWDSNHFMKVPKVFLKIN